MRREGWERRLYTVLEQARARPYELGAHDCFRVACRVLEALTGEDRWPQFEGRYGTKREAMRLLAEHGGTFEEAFDWFFARRREDVRLARRGDIVAIQTPDGEKHLGICDGARTAYLAPAGLTYLPTGVGICCWRI